MGIALQKSDAEHLVALEGTIDIACAAELKTLLLEALDSGAAVRVSLDAATYLDVTAMQLLWAAAQQARRSGQQFQFSSPPPEPVSAALLDAGFPSFSDSVHAG
jgi:anti-anti-sigma factor